MDALTETDVDSRLWGHRGGMGGLSHELIYPHSLERLRVLETEGKTKTEPEKEGPDRQTDLRQETDLQGKPHVAGTQHFPKLYGSQPFHNVLALPRYLPTHFPSSHSLKSWNCS